MLFQARTTHNSFVIDHRNKSDGNRYYCSTERTLSVNKFEIKRNIR